MIDLQEANNAIAVNTADANICGTLAITAPVQLRSTFVTEGVISGDDESDPWTLSVGFGTWSIDGGTTWHSGTSQLTVPQGDYVVSFGPIVASGIEDSVRLPHKIPDVSSAHVTAGGTASVVGRYITTGWAAYDYDQPQANVMSFGPSPTGSDNVIHTEGTGIDVYSGIVPYVYPSSGFDYVGPVNVLEGGVVSGVGGSGTLTCLSGGSAAGEYWNTSTGSSAMRSMTVQTPAGQIVESWFCWREDGGVIRNPVQLFVQAGGSADVLEGLYVHVQPGGRLGSAIPIYSQYLGVSTFSYDENHYYCGGSRLAGGGLTVSSGATCGVVSNFMTVQLEEGAHVSHIYNVIGAVNPEWAVWYRDGYSTQQYETGINKYDYVHSTPPDDYAIAAMGECMTPGYVTIQSGAVVDSADNVYGAVAYRYQYIDGQGDSSVISTVDVGAEGGIVIAGGSIGSMRNVDIVSGYGSIGSAMYVSSIQPASGTLAIGTLECSRYKGSLGNSAHVQGSLTVGELRLKAGEAHVYANAYIGTAHVSAGAVLRISGGTVDCIVESGGFVEGATAHVVPNYIPAISSGSATLHSGTTLGSMQGGQVTVYSGGSIESGAVLSGLLDMLTIRSGATVHGVISVGESAIVDIWPGAIVDLVVANCGNVIWHGGNNGLDDLPVDYPEAVDDYYALSPARNSEYVTVLPHERLRGYGNGLGWRTTVDILSGGYAMNISAGAIYASSGAVASAGGIVVSSGGMLEHPAGFPTSSGVVINSPITVKSGGILLLWPTDMVNNVTSETGAIISRRSSPNSNRIVHTIGDGQVYSSILCSTAKWWVPTYYVVESGGVLEDITVSGSSGQVFVEIQSGGLVSGAVLSSGTIYVHSGGTLVSADQADRVVVDSGGTATDMIPAGGLLYSRAGADISWASGTTRYRQGNYLGMTFAHEIDPDNVGVVIPDSCTLVFNGASLNGCRVHEEILKSGTVDSFGQTISVYAGNRQVMEVSSGGTASSWTVPGRCNGSQWSYQFSCVVDSGGTAVAPRVYDWLVVSSGGTALDVSLESSAQTTIYAGAVVTYA